MPSRDFIRPQEDQRAEDGEHQGATYRTLGYIARRVGMYTDQRAFWMRECEDLHLTQRHAGHIIARLDDQQEKPA